MGPGGGRLRQTRPPSTLSKSASELGLIPFVAGVSGDKALKMGDC